MEIRFLSDNPRRVSYHGRVGVFQTPSGKPARPTEIEKGITV